MRGSLAYPVRAGILGNRWGRMHVGALRAAGCEVVALVGQDPVDAAEIARQEGIPRSDAEALDEVDLVVIATPAQTHAALCACYAGRAVLCEKPLMAEALPDTSRLGVNYAFAFLPAARALTERLPASCPLTIAVSAGQGGRWCAREVAVHPLSWAQHTFGDIEVRGISERGALLSASLVAGRRSLSLVVMPAIESHQITITIKAPGGPRLDSVCAPGAPWRYRLDDVALDLGEGDPWIAANHASVAAFVSHVRGELLDPRAFDGARAQRFERGIAALIAV